MNTPVLFIIFTRKDTAEKVFEAIRKAAPSELYIAADGPRPNRPDDARRCMECRRIVEKVDWPCKVKTCFRENNLGCGLGVKAAIDWFFSEVEEGIILEDDCLPHPDFFLFCGKLLEYYRHDTRVMNISGNNFQFGQIVGDGSYYFSRYSYTWGWATWRRAWELFDFEMKTYPEFRAQNIIADIFQEREAQLRWTKLFDKVYHKDKNFSVWDIQWTYALFANNGLSISPNVNLISNIGYESTHEMNRKIMGMPTAAIDNLEHPRFMVPNRKSDWVSFKNTVAGHNLLIKIGKKIVRIIKRFWT